MRLKRGGGKKKRENNNNNNNNVCDQCSKTSHLYIKSGKKKMEKEKQKWRRKSSFGLLVTKMAEVVVNAEEIKAGEKENEPCRGKSEK